MKVRESEVGVSMDEGLKVPRRIGGSAPLDSLAWRFGLVGEYADQTKQSVEAFYPAPAVNGLCKLYQKAVVYLMTPGFLLRYL
jgi:hypothetical protein